jgi:hypothetical protein
VRSFLLGILLLASCGGEEQVELLVELRTDYAPGAEFTGVRTELADTGRSADFVATREDDFFAGVRVAELGGVSPGQRLVRVSLLGADGALATRDVRVDHERSFALTVVMTRDCEGVSCGDGETCVGGRCADVSCSEENPAACPAAECSGAGDCPMAAGCATSRCITGTCLFDRDDSVCGSTQYCEPEMGCAMVPGGMSTAPEGMALVEGGDLPVPFYIDLYEASIDSAARGSEDQDMDGDGKLANRAVADAHGLPFDDDGGEEAVIPTLAVASSVAGVMPAGGLTWHQAAAACVNAGKRLCTSQEWTAACGGPFRTRYTYESEDHVPDTCNEAAMGVVPTGTYTGCTNSYGVFDMNGNVQEWTEWRPPSEAEYRGGAEDEGPGSSRCDYGANYADSSGHRDIGFRCCLDVD